MMIFKNSFILIFIVFCGWAIYSSVSKVTHKSIAETTPQEVNKMQSLEQWRHSQFIQEVENGNIERVFLEQNLTKAIVFRKNDTRPRQVTLPNDPELINYLITHKVNIDVIPANKNIDIAIASGTGNTENVEKAPYVTELWSYSKLLEEIDKNNIASVSINQDLSELNVTPKNDPKNKLVYLPINSKLIGTLVRNKVDVSIIPQKIYEKGKQLEQWSYTRFVQQVERGAVSRVSLSADRTVAIVTLKQDTKNKIVYLVDDPELINTLVSKNVDISVLP
jgi:ATP-dependent Zn protease